MKKILIEMEKLSRPYTGLGQFCKFFGRFLLKQQPLPFDPVLYLEHNDKDFFGDQVKVSVCSKLHRLLPFLAPKVDVWHATNQTTRYRPSNKKCKYILTVHDLNFFYNKPQHKKAKYLRRLQKKIDRADVITAISKYVAEDIKRYCRLDGQELKVIYNGVEDLTLTKVKPIDGLASRQKFFLNLGFVGHSKNQEVLVPVLQNFKDYVLVLAGTQSDSYVNKLKNIANNYGVSERLIFLGSVSAEEKAWLYQNMTALLHPALTEGFGLPVIEAMQFGKPVFLANATAMPEVGGEEAYYFSGMTTEQLSQDIAAGLASFEQDSAKPERIKQWAEQFTWQRAIAGYLEVYKTLL